MDKKILEECIDNNMSIREIAKIQKKGYSTIKYWLDKYKLKTKKTNIQKDKVCPHHKDATVKRDSAGKWRCKKCASAAVIKRRKLLKLKAIEYKGGACEICKYSKYYGALEFHHIDPSKKDFGIAANGLTRAWEKIKQELDKCQLLCANCHREVHAEKEVI